MRTHCAFEQNLLCCSWHRTGSKLLVAVSSLFVIQKEQIPSLGTVTCYDRLRWSWDSHHLTSPLTVDTVLKLQDTSESGECSRVLLFPRMLCSPSDWSRLLCNHLLFWRGSSFGHTLSHCTWLLGSQGSCLVRPPQLHQIYRQRFAL